MKKISRTVAMILVLVMLACSFTSCLTYTRGLGLLTILDVIFLPISLLALLIYVIITDASNDVESLEYLVNMDQSIYSEYYFLAEKINSLSGEELASLRQMLASIPEVERITSIEKLTSLSETKRVSLVSAYNSIPETEMISTIERMNSLSETELVSLMQKFNSLSETELDSLIEEFKSRYQMEYVASVDRVYSYQY